MALTPEQQQMLHDDMASDPVLSQIPSGPDGAFEIAVLYSVPSDPPFWVWRTSLTEAAIQQEVGPDGTTWSYTLYINRSQGERDCWARMFSQPVGVNPARPNWRQGVTDIFSGAGGAPQRTHVLAMGRRVANRAEALFALGVGSAANPATMTFEGLLTYPEVQAAREMP